jgi:small-conductance mechanosensitive channel
VTVVLALAILYAHLVPPLRAMGSALLTGASVISVVLGLAAQNTLANLIAGMALLLYQPFRLGDRLVVSTPKGVVTGTITSLTLGYTLLETAAAEEVVVPNIVMATVVIVREPAAPRSANPRSAE